MRVSTTKSSVVPFTRKRKIPPISLKYKGCELAVESKFKYLRITFDTRLTYRYHIDNVHTKCLKRINLMRLLAGSSWGAQKRSLVAIYRALVRSVLEYGLEVFHFAPKKYLIRLERIQACALRICYGAMRSTPICALQVACKEMPLDLRHQYLSLRFKNEILGSNNHP